MSRKRQATIHIHSRAGSSGGWDTATYLLLNEKRAALVGGFDKKKGYECWYEVPEGTQVDAGGGFVAAWDGTYWRMGASLTDAEVMRIPSFNGKDYRIIEGKPW